MWSEAKSSVVQQILPSWPTVGTDVPVVRSRFDRDATQSGKQQSELKATVPPAHHAAKMVEGTLCLLIDGPSSVQLRQRDTDEEVPATHGDLLSS